MGPSQEVRHGGLRRHPRILRPWNRFFRLSHAHTPRLLDGIRFPGRLDSVSFHGQGARAFSAHLYCGAEHAAPASVSNQGIRSVGHDTPVPY